MRHFRSTQGSARPCLVWCVPIRAFKDNFLRVLDRTPAWHHLDAPCTFRASIQGERLPGVPVHLQDQALFDAVDAMRRHIQSAITNTHVKVKVFTRFDGAKRHSVRAEKKQRMAAEGRKEHTAQEHKALRPTLGRWVAESPTVIRQRDGWCR